MINFIITYFNIEIKKEVKIFIKECKHSNIDFLIHL